MFSRLKYKKIFSAKKFDTTIFLASRSIVVGAMAIFSSAITMITSMLYARVLGVDEFGELAAMLSIATLLTTLVCFGGPQLMEREIPIGISTKQQTHIRGALINSLCVLAGFSTLCALAIFLTGGNKYFFILIFVFSSVCFSLLISVNNGFDRVFQSTIITSATRSLCIFFVSYVALIGFDISSANAVITIQSITISFLAFIVFLILKSDNVLKRISAVIKRESKWTFGLEHQFIAIKAGGILMLAQLAINASTQLDILILSALADNTDVAHYFSAARAATVVSMFNGAALALLSPKIIRYVAAGESVNAESVIRSAARIGFSLTMLAAAVAYFGSSLYFNFFGPTYASAESSLVVLIFAFCMISIFGPAQVVLMAYRREKLVFLSTFAGLAINVLISVALVPKYGIIGAAIGTASHWIFYMGSQTVLLFHIYNIRSDIFSRSKNIEIEN